MNNNRKERKTKIMSENPKARDRKYLVMMLAEPQEKPEFWDKPDFWVLGPTCSLLPPPNRQ